MPPKRRSVTETNFSSCRIRQLQDLLRRCWLLWHVEDGHHGIPEAREAQGEGEDHRLRGERFPKALKESFKWGPCQTNSDPGSRREAILYRLQTTLPFAVSCCLAVAGVLFRVVVEDQTLGGFAKSQIAHRHDPEVHHQGEAECSCYHLQGSRFHTAQLCSPLGLSPHAAP